MRIGSSIHAMNAFSALSDPSRRQILELLAHKGQMQATDIYSEFPSSASAISQHLKILRSARLVTVERDAKLRLYSVNMDTLCEVSNWVAEINQVWAARMNRLSNVLLAMKGTHVK